MTQAINRLCVSLENYFMERHRKEPMHELSGLVRDVRILIQQILIDTFLPLSLDQAKDFRGILTDQLHGLCGSLRDSVPSDEKHHLYCVQGIISCFKTAEKIKEEIPDDFYTQRILIMDIPILRPFDYGEKHRPKR